MMTSGTDGTYQDPHNDLTFPFVLRLFKGFTRCTIDVLRPPPSSRLRVFLLQASEVSPSEDESKQTEIIWRKGYVYVFYRSLPIQSFS